MDIFSFILQVIMNYCEAFVMIGFIFLFHGNIRRDNICNVKNVFVLSILASSSYIIQEYLYVNTFILNSICLILYFIILKVFYIKFKSIKLVVSIILTIGIMFLMEIVIYVPITMILGLNVMEVRNSICLCFIFSMIVRLIEFIILIILYKNKGGIINEKNN